MQGAWSDLPYTSLAVDGRTRGVGPRSESSSNSEITSSGTAHSLHCPPLMSDGLTGHIVWGNVDVSGSSSWSSKLSAGSGGSSGRGVPGHRGGGNRRRPFEAAAEASRTFPGPPPTAPSASSSRPQQKESAQTAIWKELSGSQLSRTSAQQGSISGLGWDETQAELLRIAGMVQQKKSSSVPSAESGPSQEMSLPSASAAAEQQRQRWEHRLYTEQPQPPQSYSCLGHDGFSGFGVCAADDRADRGGLANTTVVSAPHTAGATSASPSISGGAVGEADREEALRRASEAALLASVLGESDSDDEHEARAKFCDSNGNIDLEKLPSQGSVDHWELSCRPCHYIHSRTGCNNGYMCEFCHMKHSKRSRLKVPKPSRMQVRALACQIHSGGESPEAVAAEAQLLALTSNDARLGAYATSVLRSLRGGAVLLEGRSNNATLRAAQGQPGSEAPWEPMGGPSPASQPERAALGDQSFRHGRLSACSRVPGRYSAVTQDGPPVDDNWTLAQDPSRQQTMNLLGWSKMSL